jgi:hypothetical protein
MARRTLIRVTSYRRSLRGKTQRRSIIRLTRMPRIRQLDGLNLSIVCSISPFRAPLRILTQTDFHNVSRAEGPI